MRPTLAAEELKRNLTQCLTTTFALADRPARESPERCPAVPAFSEHRDLGAAIATSVQCVPRTVTLSNCCPLGKALRYLGVIVLTRCRGSVIETQEGKRRAGRRIRLGAGLASGYACQRRALAEVLDGPI